MHELDSVLSGDEIVYCDMTAIGDYAEFFKSVPEEERLLIAGGDGTLNRFINDTIGILPERDIYYFAAGSGNDFLHDLGKKKGAAPFCIDDYIKDLPIVTVKGKITVS